MTIQVNPIVSPRIITIPEADGESITIQSLVNQIRDWEDDQTNLCYPKLLSASGKESLGGDVYVGITAVLENAKLKFADRTSPTDCDVLGGNLVAIDEYGNPTNPIQHSANVTVTVSKSSSATMVWDAVINEIQIQVGEAQYQIANVQETVDRLPPKPADEDDIRGAIHL